MSISGYFLNLILSYFVLAFYILFWLFSSPLEEEEKVNETGAQTAAEFVAGLKLRMERFVEAVDAVLEYFPSAPDCTAGTKLGPRPAIQFCLEGVALEIELWWDKEPDDAVQATVFLMQESGIHHRSFSSVPRALEHLASHLSTPPTATHP